jgi:xanthine/CO dehydrogenase XdhC/CoxF family maturation factor
MLILDDGTRIGTISGGCLESDVVRKAWWWTDAGASLRSFDNSSEEAAWDFGLGCNGIITVLLERLETPAVQHMLAFLDAQQAQRKPSVVATVIRSENAHYSIGQRLFYDERGIVNSDNPGLGGLLFDVMQTTLSEGKSRLMHLDTLDVFIEWIGAPQRLFIFGAGHDAMPLTSIALTLGWHVTVADHRPTYLQTGRFPGTERLFAIPASGDITDLAITSDDAVVLMTHNYPQDLILLPQVLAKQPRYLGLLGPRKRMENLFAEIGVNPYRQAVYGPTGLDIGGDHPETIALSIAAEIQSVLSLRTGSPLRQRQASIHAPALESGNTRPDGSTLSEPAILSSCGIDYA